MAKAVFLDRDDTLIDTTGVTAGSGVPGDLYDPGLIRLLPGIESGLSRLVDAGFVTVVYSNQGGVARGSGTLRDCERVNAAVRAALKARTGRDLLGPFYVCPFHPSGSVAPFVREHSWRKPGPGMIIAAAAELGIDLSLSWAVGDKPRDVQCAVAAGIVPARALLLGATGCEMFSKAVDVIVGCRGAAG